MHTFYAAEPPLDNFSDILVQLIYMLKWFEKNYEHIRANGDLQCVTLENV